MLFLEVTEKPVEIIKLQTWYLLAIYLPSHVAPQSSEELVYTCMCILDRIGI